MLYFIIIIINNYNNNNIFFCYIYIYKNQLWYAHYDDSPSFSDYTEFGGWKDPHMKQFKGTTTECDAGVDLVRYLMK